MPASSRSKRSGIQKKVGPHNLKRERSSGKADKKSIESGDAANENDEKSTDKTWKSNLRFVVVGLIVIAVFYFALFLIISNAEDTDAEDDNSGG